MSTVPIENTAASPACHLKSGRNFIVVLLLSIITFGIYGIVFFSVISSDINQIASRYDGKKTMHYCLLLFIVAPITLGIGAIVWMHRLCGRMGDELVRRNLPVTFNSSTFWLWNVLGALIIVGPFVFLHKLCKAADALADDYNEKGA